MEKEPRELYYEGKIDAEEYVRLLLENNEFDKTRKEIVKEFNRKLKIFGINV